MEFIHISDTHLGYNQYGLLERSRDFFDVFMEGVEYAIEHRVDFVLHTGDFFHSSRPSNNVLIQGMEIVQKLRQAKIPIFVISGNHDRGSQVRDVSPLSILQPVGLQLVDKGVVEHEGIYIAGLKYLSKAGLRQVSLREVLEYYLEESGDGFKILMLHQEFQPFFPDSPLNVHRDIPEGFDYVGIGHYHVAQPPAQVNGFTLVYPGSTEFTAYNEKEEEKGKGFYHVRVNGKEVNAQFVNLKKRRPFLNMEIGQDTGIEDIIRQVREGLERIENEKKPVLVMKGKVKDLSYRELIAYLEKEGILKHLLHVQLNLTRDVDITGEGIVMEIKQDRVKEEIKRLIDDTTLSEDVIDLIDSLRNFDTIDEAKKFLKENPELLDF